MKIQWNKDGLLPAIIQDAQSGQVLMQGFMNEASYKKTLDSQTVWFFSRSRQTLWQKGQTSGHYLRVVDMALDCDQDSLLVLARPEGPTCHTGDVSCFGDLTPASQPLLRLENRLLGRAAEEQKNSYTQYLLDQGIEKILKKVGEESAEVIIATLAQNKTAICDEIADLIYHLTVLLQVKNLSWQDVFSTLEERRSKD